MMPHSGITMGMRRSRFGVRQTCCRVDEEARFRRLHHRPAPAPRRREQAPYGKRRQVRRTPKRLRRISPRNYSIFPAFLLVL